MVWPLFTHLPLWEPILPSQLVWLGLISPYRAWLSVRNGPAAKVPINYVMVYNAMHIELDNNISDPSHGLTMPLTWKRQHWLQGNPAFETTRLLQQQQCHLSGSEMTWPTALSQGQWCRPCSDAPITTSLPQGHCLHLEDVATTLRTTPPHNPDLETMASVTDVT
jgi:hypothetical protein